MVHLYKSQLSEKHCQDLGQRMGSDFTKRINFSFWLYIVGLPGGITWSRFTETKRTPDIHK